MASSTNNTGKRSRDPASVPVGEHHDSNFSTYMAHKQAKLHEQYGDEFAAAPQQGIFDGVSVYINGRTAPSSDVLKALLGAHGGKHQQYLSRTNVTHVVATNLPDSKIKQELELKKLSNRMPFVLPAWIVDSVAQGRKLAIEPYLLDCFREGAGALHTLGVRPVVLPSVPATSGSSSSSSSSNSRASAAAPAASSSSGAAPATTAAGASPPPAAKPTRSGAAPAAPVVETWSSRDPEFMQGFFNSSRLHFIGAARAHVQTLVASELNSREGARGGAQAAPSSSSAATSAAPSGADGGAYYDADNEEYGEEGGGGGRYPMLSDQEEQEEEQEGGSADDQEEGGGEEEEQELFGVEAEQDGLLEGDDAVGFPGVPSSSAARSKQRAPPSSSVVISQAWIDPSRPRVIAHCDVDCFFVQVALLKRPDLVGLPVVVAHSFGNGPGMVFRSLASAQRQQFGDGVDTAPAAATSLPPQVPPVASAAASAAEPSAGAGSSRPMYKGQYAKYQSFGGGEVSSASYEARAAGVHAGMPVEQAQSLCPALAVLPYDFEGIRRVSEAIMLLFLRLTPLVQAVSCDEAYLDLSSVRNPLQAVAGLRASILAETGCTVSAGLSSNMLLARLATAKAKPNGLFALLPADAAAVGAFLAPLPASSLPGVGWSTRSKLEARGVCSVAELCAVPKGELQALLGPGLGEQLWHHARGEDGRPLQLRKPRKSIGLQTNWGIRFTEKAQVTDYIAQLATELGRRMREAGRELRVVAGHSNATPASSSSSASEPCQLTARSVTLSIMRRKEGAGAPSKFMGHGHVDSYSLSRRLAASSCDPAVLASAAEKLYQELGCPPDQLRGIGIHAKELVHPALQREGADGGAQGRRLRDFFRPAAAAPGVEAAATAGAGTVPAYSLFSSSSAVAAAAAAAPKEEDADVLRVEEAVEDDVIELLDDDNEVVGEVDGGGRAGKVGAATEEQLHHDSDATDEVEGCDGTAAIVGSVGGTAQRRQEVVWDLGEASKDSTASRLTTRAAAAGVTKQQPPKRAPVAATASSSSSFSASTGGRSDAAIVARGLDPGVFASLPPALQSEVWKQHARRQLPIKMLLEQGQAFPHAAKATVHHRRLQPAAPKAPRLAQTELGFVPKTETTASAASGSVEEAVDEVVDVEEEGLSSARSRGGVVHGNAPTAASTASATAAPAPLLLPSAVQAEAAANAQQLARLLALPTPDAAALTAALPAALSREPFSSVAAALRRWVVSLGPAPSAEHQRRLAGFALALVSAERVDAVALLLAALSRFCGEMEEERGEVEARVLGYEEASFLGEEDREEDRAAWADRRDSDLTVAAAWRGAAVAVLGTDAGSGSGGGDDSSDAVAAVGGWRGVLAHVVGRVQLAAAAVTGHGHYPLPPGRPGVHPDPWGHWHEAVNQQNQSC